MANTTRESAAGDGALRHIVLVGGTPAQWSVVTDDSWERRLADLGKVADHVGASWLVLRPYAPEPDAPAAPTRVEVVGGCTVVASPDADGRARLVAATEQLRRSGAEITESSLAGLLNAPATVDPDLVVVLGPGHRLPPSLVWELAYSELVFVHAAWPDLQPSHVERAVDEYSHRHRRFGGLD